MSTDAGLLSSVTLEKTFVVGRQGSVDTLLHCLVADSFSDCQSVTSVALRNGVTTLFKLLYNLFTSFRGDGVNAGYLAISHAHNSVGEVLESLVVSHHNHSNFLLLV